MNASKVYRLVQNVYSGVASNCFDGRGLGFSHGTSGGCMLEGKGPLINVFVEGMVVLLIYSL